MTRWWVVFLPAAAGFLAYLPALFGTWVWDDHLVIGRQLRAFRSIPDVFFPPAGIPSFSGHYYRPLVTASYLLDRFLFGERPLGFHLTLLAAHALAATLVLLLVRSMMGRSRDADWASLTAALLFAVHPVHVESVAWITGRADVMAGVCLLGAALALRVRPLRLRGILGSCVLFCLGCLFKEVAYAFLPLAPLFLWVPTEPHEDVAVPRGAIRGSGRGAMAAVPAGTRWAACAAFAGCAALMLLVRRQALGHLGGDVPRGGGGSWIEALGGALAFYLTRAIAPLPARAYVADLPHGAAALAGLAAAVVLIGASMALLRRPAGRTAGVGLVCFLGLLLPSLAPVLLRISSVPVAERYLYVPTAFGSLALAPALRALLRRSRGRLVTASLLAGILVLAAITAMRTRIWRDEVSFWTAASGTATAAFPRISLATALEERGDHGRAEQLYRSLLGEGPVLDPGQSALVHMNLGAVLRATSRLPEARLELEEAVRRDPSQPLAWFNLATVLWELAILDPGAGTADRATIERADFAAGQAVRLSPFDPDCWLLEGRIAGALGRPVEARSSLGRAVDLDPQGEAGATARKLLALMR